jgi:type VI secretion system secreted protein VgrG
MKQFDVSAMAEALAKALGLSSDRRLYDLAAEGPLAELLPESVAVRDTLNEPWLMQLCALSTSAQLDTDAMIGQRIQLLTRLADGSHHTRSGLVASAAFDGADGGLARYVLTVQPWLGLLARTRHSAVWQERSVTEVIDAVFGSYANVAAWHWSPCAQAHLAQSHQGGVRSYVVQHRETDLEFVQRLLAHEGLVLRLEEHADAPTGQRAVILADTPSSESCPLDATSAADGGIRFHRASSQERQDAIQALGGLRSLPAAVSSTLVWDYKTKRTVSAEVPTAAAFGGANAPRVAQLDTLATYRFAHEGDAERAMTLAQQAIESRHKTWLGRSTVRTFAPGRQFDLLASTLDVSAALKAALSGERSSNPDDTRFVLTAVVHAGLNNLPKDARSRLGTLAHGGPSDPDTRSHWPAWVDDEVLSQAQRTGYGNAFEAIRAYVPWRPALFDEAGAPLHPGPRLNGSLTATVVGPDGQTRASGDDEIHTDALGRIRVALNFQHATLAPHANTSTASTWVRVVQRLAGPGMGWQFIPRVGQEVVVDFVDGAMDRPLVVGAVYNGQGEAGVPATPGGAGASADTSALSSSSDHRASAQGNRISSGHSPAWHGAAPGAASEGAAAQANPAALNGIKTQGFGSSGSDYNQLVLDDSAAQLRVQLATTQHATQLNLGHLVHQADNHRGSLRGAGFELRTDAYGALRAASGWLITSHGEAGTADVKPTDGHNHAALDNVPAAAIAGRFKTLAASLAPLSDLHQSGTLAMHAGSGQASASALAPQGSAKAESPAAAWHTALKGMVNADAFDAAQSDAANKTNSTEADKLPSPTDAAISLHAKAGWAQVAGADVHLSAAQHITLASGQDSHWAAGGTYRLHTGQAIGVLAGAVKKGSGAAGTGITAIAAKGDTELQAQAGPLEIAAKNAVTIQSEKAQIDWAAAKKITLATAGGASVTIEGGNITFECPGTITVRAGTKSFSGGGSVSYSMPFMPQVVCVECLKRRAGERTAFVKKGA